MLQSTGVGKACPNRYFVLTSQICLLMLFANIKCSRFLNSPSLVFLLRVFFLSD